MTMQNLIESKLNQAFEPTHMEVINESHNHNVPKGSESHFKVLMVSGAFQGKASVMRHRMVNRILADELADGIHALTMRLLTPEQWQAAGQEDHTTSPPCAHK